MTSFDFAPLLAPGLPPPAAKWTGFAKYNFTGGHNDADHVPVDELLKAATDVLAREGRNLATIRACQRPARLPSAAGDLLAQKLKRAAGISCSADEILISSGSLQALDLVNALLLDRGDTVIIEQATYQGATDASGAAWQLRPSASRSTPRACAVMDALASRAGIDDLEAPRHPPQIHLHHSDRAESDRHDHERSTPA